MNVHKKRREKLGIKMQSNSVFALFSGMEKHKSHDEFYAFYPSMNFYYLTGVNQDNVILLMVKEGTTVREYLFVEQTTAYMRQWLGEKISKQKASNLSGVAIGKILWRKQFDDTFHNIVQHSNPSNASVPNVFYLDLFSYKQPMKPLAYDSFSKQLKNCENLTVKNINDLLYPMRMVKDEVEIANLKQAISITNSGLKRIIREIPRRENEMELEADFLHQIRLKGAKEVSFKTIAASGENATVLHYEDNESSLAKNDLILFDLGAKFNYYSADISRTYPLCGTFSERQKEIYEVVLQANKAAIKAVKPGMTWTSLNDIATSILQDGALRLGIISNPKEIVSYYYHSVGHYLGLDTHDVGSYKEVLQEGMVITIEPGLYVKEERIGVRIEDNILVTKGGCINLSENIIKEIDDIEKYMKNE